MSTNKQLLSVPEKCTGCNRCTYVCSALKEGRFAPAQARLHVNNYPLRGYSVPSVCFQCPKPECLDACPEKAIYKDNDGVVRVDATRCDGCGDCVGACPYGLMAQSPMTGRAFKCDTCDGDPACVQECRFGALLFIEPDRELVRLRGLQMKQRSAAGSAEARRQALGTALLGEARP